MSATISKLRVGTMDNCVYIVSSPSTGEGVIVDAAAEPETIISACEGLTIGAILTTHGHHDHIGAVAEVSERLEVPFRLHPADAQIAGRQPDVPLTDDEVIEIGDVTIAALHTPGHTPGSTCFAVDGTLLTGDTLFPGGPGATRWDYSDFNQIMDSVENRLMTHPDDTPIRPGHGDDTTVGTERPHLEEWRKRGW